jgi:hypothetical protein
VSADPAPSAAAWPEIAVSIRHGRLLSRWIATSEHPEVGPIRGQGISRAAAVRSLLRTLRRARSGPAGEVVTRLGERRDAVGDARGSAARGSGGSRMALAPRPGRIDVTVTSHRDLRGGAAMTNPDDPRSELLGIAERLRHLHAEHLRAGRDSAARRKVEGDMEGEAEHLERRLAALVADEADREAWRDHARKGRPAPGHPEEASGPAPAGDTPPERPSGRRPWPR